MKILMTNFHDKDGGGHTTYIIALIKLLPQHHFIVAAPNTSKLFKILTEKKYKNATPVHVNYTAKFFDFAQKRKNLNTLSAVFKEHTDIDIVQSNTSSCHKLVIKTIRHLGLKNKIPVILAKHDSIPMSICKRLRAKHGCNRMIAVCQYTKEQLVKTGIDPNKIDVIPNGTDTDYFVPASKEQKKKAKDTLGLKEDDFVFGSVAGTAIYKGWRYLLQALKKLNLPEKFKVVLPGIPLDKEVYKREIEDLNLSNAIIMPGLSHDVREVIPAFDVGFVLSEHIETISQACREMMSMGKPILISDFSGLPENVTDNVDGWISSTSDVLDIAKKIEKIVALSKEQLEEMGKNARKKAEKEFTAEEFAKKTEECYLKTIREFAK